MIDEMIASIIVQFPMLSGMVLSFAILWQWLKDVQAQVDENQQRLTEYHKKLEDCLSSKSANSDK